MCHSKNNLMLFSIEAHYTFRFGFAFPIRILNWSSFTILLSSDLVSSNLEDKQRVRLKGKVLWQILKSGFRISNVCRT